MLPETIKRHILFLKNEKMDSFIELEDSLKMNQVFEVCRISDVLLLPMYYCWERMCHRNLTEVDFEGYLERPYEIFSNSPLNYTIEIMLLLNGINRKATLNQPFLDIVKTYNELIDNILLSSLKKKIITARRSSAKKRKCSKSKTDK